MEESLEHPPKPEFSIEPQQTNWGKTVFSVLLFFLIFNFFLGWEALLAVALIVVILVHELGHFLAMKYFGYQNVNMMFVPFLGAYTAGQKDDVPYPQELVTLLAGPVPGIIAGMIMLPFVSFEEPELFDKICFMLLGLNLFNMLPVMPLDGGKIFDRLFHRARFLIRIFFLGCALIGIVAYQLLGMKFDIFLAFIGFMILQNLVQTFKLLQSQKELRGQGLDPDKSYAELSNEEYWEFSKFVKNKIKTEVEEKLIMMHVRKLLNHSSIIRLTGGGRILFFFAWLFFLVAPLIEFLILNLKIVW